jgi:hypothetical protein
MSDSQGVWMLLGWSEPQAKAHDQGREADNRPRGCSSNGSFTIRAQPDLVPLGTVVLPETVASATYLRAPAEWALFF